MNFGPNVVNLTLSATGLQAGINTSRSAVTVLTSNDSLDENSFDDPLKVRWRLCFAYGLFVSYGICTRIFCKTCILQLMQVKPVKSGLPSAAEEMQAMLVPHSFTSFDLDLDQYGELVADM